MSSPSRPWRAPERATLLPAFLPALVALAVVVVVIAGLLFAPRFIARTPETFRATATQAFVWTPTEAQRLRSSGFARNGVLAERLEPWRDAPEPTSSSGGSLLSRAFAFFKRKALDPVTRSFKSGDEATAPYHSALALYRSGDYAQAQDRAQKALDAIKAQLRDAGANDRMRLDGEQATAAYLLGHARLRRGDADGAIKAFDEALKAARSAHSYPAYGGATDPLFALDPRYSHTDLSIADVWNDKLAVLDRKDPDKALAAAAELFEAPAAVAAHPLLASTLQVIAAEAGQTARVAAIEPNWQSVPAGDAQLDRARRASAAAMLVGGDPRFMSELEGSSERDLFAPWVRLARERQLLKSEVSEPDAAPPAAPSEASGDDAVFLKRWRAEYLGRLGEDLLARARTERQPGYYAAILQSRIFPASVTLSAAVRWWGLSPWLAGIIVAILALVPLALALGGFVYYETFSALHYANRLRKLRKAAADPLAGMREARG